jgi:hypothetical protein
MAKTVGWLERLLQLLDEDTLPYRFEANRLEVADEITVLRALADLAAREESEIPGTSFLVRWRMKADAHWLHTLDPNRITSGDIRQLERIALRIQGLLANVPASVLL